MKLKGKVAIVTGAGRGIGRAIALALAHEGVNLALVSRTRAELDEVALEVRQSPARAIAVSADVSIQQQVDEAVKNTLAELGPVDILVNNAGVAIHHDVQEIPEADWDRTFAVNLKGAFLFCRAVFPQMMGRGQGDILNVASIGGRRPAGHYSSYCASKAGLIAFSEAIAQEGAPRNVRVSLICPGPVDTALRRKDFPEESESELLLPQDVAEAAVFLLSRPSGVFIPELTMRPLAAKYQRALR
jgi:NAD(P)-dependent dehydrogenase (short-subunit alcohol dehydrogenase family)